VKIWRTGTQYLVERGGSFCLVDSTGAVVRTYEDAQSSVEDILYITEYHVKGEELHEQTTIEHWGREDRFEDKIRLAELVVDADPETLRYILTVFGDASVRREERRIADEKAADARIAAIDGARDDFVLGADFARAQSMLRQRIYDYDDTLAASLLHTLVALARAKVHAPALAMYVRGCLFACFANAPDAVEGEPVASPLGPQVNERARELEQVADGQELADAMQNAAAYWRAAEAVRAAAKLLA
jgi:hypothetical protein